jgi:GT2 family glycosyltransferase
VRISCVVLTTGERPAEFEAALDSVRRQRAVETELIVVRNAPGPTEPPVEADGVLWVSPGENLGIPGGRNLGVEHATGELVLFLDDDGLLVGSDVLARAGAMFAADPSLAVVTMRIVDPQTGGTQRRHVPRPRVGDPARSSWVTSFLGGASIVRRSVFEEVGGYPADFFYAHEETSVGWRLIDRGYRLRYAADLVMHHPGIPPARHAQYHHLSARNRVLLVRMHLPLPVAVLHLLVWTAATLLRQRTGFGASARGLADGLRARDVPRQPIRWRTVWRLTRYGRPPIV